MGYDDETPIPALKGRVCGFKNQINEGSHAPRPPMPYARAEMAMSAKAVPIAAGESSFQSQVSVTFAIER